MIWRDRRLRSASWPKPVPTLFSTPGGEGDLGKEEQAASLAEPAYTPPGGAVAVGGVLEDLLEEALRETDAAVLCRLKAVTP